MLYLKPYKRYCAMARKIRQELRAKNILCKRYLPTHRLRRTDWLMYIGNAEHVAGVDRYKSLNYNANLASNKLRTFQAWAAHANPPRFVPFTSSIQEANKWLADGAAVLARRRLSAHSGIGINIYEPHTTISQATERNTTLFTKYIKKRAEYRVHVFNNKVIDFQQKKKRSNVAEEINTRIRSWNNGWVYTRNGVRLPPDVKVQALQAVATLGLEFGAVDVLWNDRAKQAYVLEVNTAPAMEGTTIKSYVNALITTLNLTENAR